MNAPSSFLIHIPIFLAATLLLGVPLADAYVASSSSYRIQADSINTGGNLSTSTNYSVQDTLGESAVGTSSSISYQVKAGYQQMQQVYIALAVPGNLTLVPNIPSTGGGTANGVGVWNVVTDDAAGYSMTIRASTSPALQSGVKNFPDYTPGGAVPDFTFTTPASASRFGFSPEGGDIIQRYKDNGAACNAGALDTASACWDALSTTATAIAASQSANHPSGTQTTIRFRASSDAGNIQPAGSYSATATVTILPR